MATIDTNLDAPPTDPPVRIECVAGGSARLRRQVLSLLLTGERHSTDGEVARFKKFLRQQKLSLDQLYAALVDDEPRAAALVLPSAGRTAILLCSPVEDRRQIALTTQVVKRAVADAAQGQNRLIQSLTDPGQRRERRALGHSGFTELATLIYMERSVPTGIGAPRIEPMAVDELTSMHWSPRNRQAFETAVLESYVNTLDCPGLLGLRSIQDVIDGHMATGKFDPKLWWAFYHRDQPVAVLLLARVPQREAHELVYLGVTEPYRGLGLGSKLVELALHSVSRRGGGRMFLAVDQKNRPAVQLYRQHRFRVNAHKRAMIYTLPAAINEPTMTDQPRL